MRSNRRQPAAVPPAAAIRAADRRNLPPTPFCTFPLAVPVVMVNVVLPGVDGDTATFTVWEPVLPNPYVPEVSVAAVTATTAVPV